MSNLFACSTLSTDINVFKLYETDNIYIYIYYMQLLSKQTCKYIMSFIILPAVDPGIRYEQYKTKNITVCVKDVLYVIAIALAVST